MFILYGRRRVGKTELLVEFTRNKRAVYFTASQVATGDNLNQLTMLTSQQLGRSELEGLTFKTLESYLEYIANLEGTSRLVLVLDEFQYWVSAERSIPSMIQRFWDRIGKKSQLMLVLCGSSISMMVDYTLAEKSPLYGRRTGQLELEPMDYRTASRFFPTWSEEERLSAFGILGGIPAYLEQFDPQVSLAENIKDKMLHKGRYLAEEAHLLFKTELRDPTVYFSILRAIASGCTTMKDLASRVNLDARAVSTYVSNLQTLHIVTREIPFNEPRKSRKGRYFVKDNFLKFWFSLVEPNQTLLDINQGERLFDQLISPRLSTYMGPVFEEICRQYLLLFGEEAGLPVPVRLGKIWHRDYDIDIVTENLDATNTIAECKWSKKTVDRRLIYQLRQRAETSGFMTAQKHLVLFTSSGFKGGEIEDSLFIDCGMLLPSR